jgi:hypothetical protein
MLPPPGTVHDVALDKQFASYGMPPSARSIETFETSLNNKILAETEKLSASSIRDWYVLKMV